MAIRSDNGSEFKNYTVEGFLSDEGIAHQYSTPYTPQQNGVAERKNRTLMDAARTMIAEFASPYNFWAEAVSTVCHATNRLYLRKLLDKTPYEILTNKKPDLSYFKVFGCKCFILKKGNRLSKFETSSYEGIFVGYATNSHAYRVYNKSTGQVEEAIDVRFDEDNGSQGGRIDHDVVGDAIPPIVIRRMGIGEIIPVEETLVMEGEGQSSTQVEPSLTPIDTQAIQIQASSPQANEQGREQDHPIFDRDQPRGDSSPNDVQGQVQDGQDSDDEGDDQVISQETWRRLLLVE